MNCRTEIKKATEKIMSEVDDNNPNIENIGRFLGEIVEMLIYDAETAVAVRLQDEIDSQIEKLKANSLLMSYEEQYAYNSAIDEYHKTIKAFIEENYLIWEE